MRPTSSKWFALAASSIFLLGALTACGGKSEPTAAPTETSAPQPTATEIVPATSTPVPATATPVPPTATPVPTDTPVTDMGETSTLPDVPLPDDAEDTAYEFEEITFTSPSDVATLMSFYRDALPNDGWEEQTDLSLESDTFSYAEFERDGENISLTLISSDSTSQATVDLRGAPSLTGITVADSSGGDATGESSGATIADWPTPPDATDVNISGETLSFTTQLTLTEVAEFYRPTYEEMGLNTSCLDDVAEYTSVSCSFSNGDVTISFFAFEGFDGTEVEIEFTNNALGSTNETGELGVEEEEGLPLPDDHTGYSYEGGEFLTTVNLTSPSSMGALLEFFQIELASRGWTLDDSEGTDTDATLQFSGPDGELVVTLQAGDETTVVMSKRDPAGAEAAGILPPAGQSRLYFVNFTDSDMTVAIDGQTIEIAPGAGMDSPDDAPTLDLDPGTYDVTTTVDGSSVTDQITVGADETWGLLLDEQGALPLQMY